MSPSFFRLFLIRSFLYLQVTRTCIKSRTSSNFGQIGRLPTELAALERLKNFHRLIMGKCCLHASSFIFDRIIIKVASYLDRHKSSDEFDFGPDQTTHFGLPLDDEHFTLSNLNIAEARRPILDKLYV